MRWTVLENLKLIHQIINKRTIIYANTILKNNINEQYAAPSYSINSDNRLSNPPGFGASNVQYLKSASLCQFHK